MFSQANIPTCCLQRGIVLWTWAHHVNFLIHSFLSFFFLINLFYFFIFGCFGSSLLCTGYLQLRRVGATLRCSARASHCGGFSCCKARAPGTRASVVVACGLSSCGSRAQLLRGMWALPGPGLEPMFPALAGGFLTPVPPGKPHSFLICHMKGLADLPKFSLRPAML